MASSESDHSVHLDATLTTLESDVATLSPAAGRGIIERWLNVLGDYPEYNDIATALGELRQALTTQPIEGQRVGALLSRLGARTSQVSRDAGEDIQRSLDRLGTLLSHAGRKLGASAPADFRRPGEGVHQPSTHQGPSPSNPGRKARIGDVQGDGSSRTPGGQHRPD